MIRRGSLVRIQPDPPRTRTEVLVELVRLGARNRRIAALCKVPSNDV